MESGEESLKTSPSARDWFSSNIFVALNPRAGVRPETIGWLNLAPSQTQGSGCVLCMSGCCRGGTGPQVLPEK